MPIYQSYFYQTQDGFLKFKESGSDYYASSFSAKIQTFYEDLKAEANSKNKPRKKRWNLRSNIPSVVVKNADKLRITFMTGENGNPYRIKRVEAKVEGCEYQRICGRNSKFAKKYSLKPTVMNYIAKINEIDTALRARESYPWLDFLVKFTYPLLVVDYGTLNEESITDSLGECVANNVKEFGGDLKDYVLNEALDLVQAIAYEFNSKQSCQDLLAESEIEKKYFEKSPTPGLDATRNLSQDDLVTGANDFVNEDIDKVRREIRSIEDKIEILKLEKKEADKARDEAIKSMSEAPLNDTEARRKFARERDKAARESIRLQKSLDKAIKIELKTKKDELMALSNESSSLSVSKKREGKLGKLLLKLRGEPRDDKKAPIGKKLRSLPSKN